MIKIFDTHAHYSDEIYDTDRESLFHKMSDEGVSAITLIGASLEDSRKEKVDIMSLKSKTICLYSRKGGTGRIGQHLPITDPARKGLLR